MKTENKRRYRFLVCKEQEWEHFILHCTVVGDYQCLIEIWWAQNLVIQTST